VLIPISGNIAGNNVVECNFDGGDCCEYSCSAWATFSCGVDGYECLDPSAPEYSPGWDVDLGSLIAMGVATAALYLWCYVFCFLFFSGRETRLLDKKRRPGSGPGDTSEATSGPDTQEPQASAKALAFAWALLAVELGVTTYLYFQDEGRVSRKTLENIDDPEYPLLEEEVCTQGEGPQWVSYASFYRDGVAVVSQLLLWMLGGRTELPERAFLKMLVTAFSKCCISDRPWSRAITWQTSFQRSWWGPLLMLIVSGHMLGPILIDTMAVCAIAYDIQVLFYIVMGILVLCCNCSCACIGRRQGGLIYVVDAVLSGVMGTWANVVQSSWQLAAAFVVLPTFEVVYSVAELFACTSSYTDAGLPL